MRSAKIMMLLFLVAALSPYLIACFYALPFADDFCFGWTASAKISFLQKWLNQYLYWNGRYTSDVLVNLHPLTTGSLMLYQWICLVSIIAMLAAVFIFAKQYLKGTMVPLAFALFFLLFYLSYQPDITEGVYWYIGLVNYHWGVVCFIIQWIVFKHLWYAERNRALLLSVSLTLLALSVGFNEVSAAVIPAYYMMGLICYGTTEHRNKRMLQLHVGVAFIASALVIFSPGNFVRAAVFPGRFQLSHSLFYAAMQTARFIGKWGLSVPFVALSLVVIANAQKVKADVLKKIDFRVLLTLLVFTVFMAAFLPYMATGILGQHRTMNYALPLFMILWIGALLSASQKYLLYIKLQHLAMSRNVLLIAIVAIVGLVAHGSTASVLRDEKSHTFEEYKTEFMQRQTGIMQHPDDPIPALKNVPRTFDIVDTHNDTSYWVDKCMKRYYTETKIELH